MKTVEQIMEIQKIVDKLDAHLWLELISNSKGNTVSLIQRATLMDMGLVVFNREMTSIHLTTLGIAVLTSPEPQVV